MWKFTPQNSRKEKSKRWVKTPIVRRGSGDIYKLRRDTLIVYFYPSPLKVEVMMYPCREKRECSTVQEFKDVIEEIRSLSTDKAKIVCFVQHLDALVESGVISNVKWIGDARTENEVTYHFCAIDTHFEFRNLDPILDSDADYVTGCDDILVILGSYGIPLYKIAWSLGYITKKTLFTPELRETLWQDTKKNRRFFNDIDTYKAMFYGSSSGFLWLDENYKKQILENVSSFDIISAYNWVLVTDSHFPITIPKRTRNIEDIIDAIEKDKWFLITLKGYDLGKQYDMFLSKLPDNPKPEDFKYAFNCYDYKICSMFDNTNLSEIIENYPCEFYVASKCGRLNKDFRDSLVGLFNYKESFDDKDNPNRKIAKKQLEITYGKGMQDYQFDSIEQVISHYSHKGQNYLMPHWSKMCVSAIKYRLVRAYFDDLGVIYADTDGIKTTTNPMVVFDLFTKYNHEVEKINNAAGYPGTTLGMWKYEWTSSRFVMISKKQYCYEDEYGNIHPTLAGVPKDDLPEYINKSDDFLQTLIDGLEVTKYRLTYLKNRQEFIYKPYTVIVGKEDQDGFVLSDFTM